MSDDPYRTAAKVTSRERVEADEAIGVHEGVLAPVAFPFLPSDLRTRIETLRADDRDEGRVALAEALGEAEDFARMRQQDIATLTAEHWQPPPLDDVWGPIGVENGATPHIELITKLTRAIDPAADVRRIGPRVLTKFVASDVPITWAVDLGGLLTIRTGESVVFTKSWHTMGIPLTDDMPELHVRRETLTDSALKVVKLRKEPQIGDAAFDDTFFIEGNAELARALFTAPVREAFLVRAKETEFDFWLGGPAASLTWHGGIIAGLDTPHAFSSSVDLLVSFREAFAALRLVRI